MTTTQFTIDNVAIESSAYSGLPLLTFDVITSLGRVRLHEWAVLEHDESLDHVARTDSHIRTHEVDAMAAVFEMQGKPELMPTLDWLPVKEIVDEAERICRAAELRLDGSPAKYVGEGVELCTRNQLALYTGMRVFATGYTTPQQDSGGWSDSEIGRDRTYRLSSTSDISAGEYLGVWDDGTGVYWVTRVTSVPSKPSASKTPLVRITASEGLTGKPPAYGVRPWEGYLHEAPVTVIIPEGVVSARTAEACVKLKAYIEKQLRHHARMTITSTDWSLTVEQVGQV